MSSFIFYYCKTNNQNNVQSLNIKNQPSGNKIECQSSEPVFQFSKNYFEKIRNIVKLEINIEAKLTKKYNICQLQVQSFYE